MSWDGSTGQKHHMRIIRETSAWLYFRKCVFGVAGEVTSDNGAYLDCIMKKSIFGHRNIV